MRRASRRTGPGLLLLAAACSTEGTSPSIFDQLLDQDVATLAADAAAMDVELMRGPGGPQGLQLPAVQGAFECPSGEHHGLTVTRTCIYEDADGAVQDAYDQVTTASVTVHADVAGDVDRGHWSATIERVRDFVVTGLEGDETSITWNGTGAGGSTRVRERDGETRQYDLTHATTVTDVMIPVPRSAGGWPLSGTIHTVARVTITGGPRDGTVRERDVTITFDGTSVATVMVNGEGFEFDLASRGRAHRRP